MGASNSQPKETDESTLYTRLISVPLAADQWPIVYAPEYDVHFMESLHPFDSRKWSNIFRLLSEANLFSKGEASVVRPLSPTDQELLIVHTPQYLSSLNWSAKVSIVLQFPPLALVPVGVLRSKILNPLRLQTGGTCLAAKLALDRGWALNIGGGMHHCSGKFGGSGLCPYADITLAIRLLQKNYPERVRRVMIVDLDAHQGNGHENDFRGDPSVFIFDMYNAGIYPKDREAKHGIGCNVELRPQTNDQEYLAALRKHLPNSLAQYPPDFVLYNAGTDLLVSDLLGRLAITPEGIIERDEIVFRACLSRQPPVPLLMITSGGYQKIAAKVVTDSILNLINKGLIRREGLGEAFSCSSVEKCNC